MEKSPLTPETQLPESPNLALTMYVTASRSRCTGAKRKILKPDEVKLREETGTKMIE